MKYWDKAIADALKRGTFTAAQKSRAGNWATCACGKLHDGIERDKYAGSPYDYVLQSLGISFDYNVRNDNVKRARKTLDKIEKRAAKLLAAQRKKKP